MLESKIVTEPDGEGIRFVGFENPSPFLKRTTDNRSEAFAHLVGHTFDLESRSGRDPVIRLTPSLRFGYMTEEEMDPRTGMPKIVTKKGVKKILHSHMMKFILSTPSLFTKTSKMSAASWSLPAGPQNVDGTCAAAELYKNASKYAVALQQGEVEQRPADKKDWICAYCYAGKSNYMHRTSQYSQSVRLIWLTGMIEHHGVDGAAARMVEALRAHQGNAKARQKAKEDPGFFRIHDSGDFQLVPNTFLLWCEIARAMPEVKFWAPTRMWVFPKFVELVRRNPPPDNMSIRPSALHFQDRAPEIDGFDAGSSAHALEFDPVKNDTADWICPAYQHDGKTCAKAGGPNGERDCRVCWVHVDMAPSYRSH